MKENESPAVHIPPEHQSAPKQTWADKEIAKAAEEIRSGQFVPTVDDDDLLTVGVQRGMIPSDPNLIDMQSIRDTEALIQHPRVQEALARLELEKREAKNSQEFLEKSQMIYELNAQAAEANQWTGQDRWEGKENEEMRIGEVLQPFQFLARLEKVIGERKIMLNRYAVHGRVALLAPDRPERSLILLPGQPEPSQDGLVQVGTLQYPLSSEWMVMRFDEYGVPTTAKYLGWRTALLSLITLDLITEKQAHEAFPLKSGPASAWYREQLFVKRSKEGTVN